MKRTAAMLILTALALCSIHAQQPPPGNTARPGTQAANGATGNDWPSYGGTGLSWRYSALASINRNKRRAIGASMDLSIS
jgi:glucose dehydrogenase